MQASSANAATFAKTGRDYVAAVVERAIVGRFADCSYSSVIEY
jgi:hypothetical protein